MHICFRCGYEFSQVYNFRKHLKKQYKCDIKFLNVSRKKLLANYADIYDKYHDIYVEKKRNYVDVKVIKCKKCNKIFNHKSNCNAHIKNHCPIIKQEHLIDEFLETKYNLLKLEYEEKLDEKIEEERIKNVVVKEELENKIKDLEMRLMPIVSQTQINNGHIENNIGNSTTNIIINNYGEEKFNMTAQDCEKIMASEFDMIVKLIEYIHISTIENRNAFVPSLKEKYAMILQNQKWNLVDRTEFINNLVISKNVMLEKMLEEYGDQFEYVNPSRSQSIINYCKNDEEEYKRIKTSATLLLFNNKNMIRDTFETNYSKKIQSR
jgi:phage FluMu protein Com